MNKETKLAELQMTIIENEFEIMEGYLFQLVVNAVNGMLFAVRTELDKNESPLIRTLKISDWNSKEIFSQESWEYANNLFDIRILKEEGFDELLDDAIEI